MAFSIIYIILLINFDALLYSLKDLLMYALNVVYYNWSDEHEGTHLVLFSCIPVLFWILVMNPAFMNYIWNQLFMFEISVALLYDIKIEIGLFYIWSLDICDIFLIFFWLTIFSRESSYKVITLLNLWWSSSS